MRPGILREYDYAAEWCARNGHDGKAGSPLPDLLSGECCAAIDNDPEAFADRVRECAYALASERTAARSAVALAKVEGGAS